jgi:excisionase family DNA binding protein
MTTMNKYMTPREVATELEISPATVVRWVRDGVIPAKRFGKRIIKIPRTDVEQLVAQNGEDNTK